VEIEAKYYDGKSSKEHKVTLIFSKDGVVIQEFNKSYPLDSIKISSALGNTPSVITFLDGGRAKIEDNRAFDEILKALGYKRGFIHKLERSTKFALLSVGAIIAFVIFALTIGADSSANFLAKILPEHSLDYVSKKALEELDKNYLHPSNLTEQKKKQVRAIFATITEHNPRYKLHFRSSARLGPNAFALPSGDIVIFDSLILLDRDKNLRGIAGVLAHERAHVVYKHALKGTIKASIAVAVISYITGDLSFVATAIPTLLITNGYSREYEKEADRYAKEELRKLGIDTKPLARLFEAMDSYVAKKHKEANITIPSWVSTHPATKKRVEFFSK